MAYRVEIVRKEGSWVRRPDVGWAIRDAGLREGTTTVYRDLARNHGLTAVQKKGFGFVFHGVSKIRFAPMSETRTNKQPVARTQPAKPEHCTTPGCTDPLSGYRYCEGCGASGVDNAAATYGISRLVVRELRSRCCDICGAEPGGDKAHAIDHCHTTGAVRGVLCHSCNTAIGHMQDDIDRLQAAINYLQSGRDYRADRERFSPDH